MFFTIVGKPKYQNLDAQYGGGAEQEVYVGEEIQSLGLYKIFSPINKGKIVDWNYFEKILDYIFYNLRVDHTLVNVLFAIHPLFPKKPQGVRPYGFPLFPNSIIIFIKSAYADHC